MLNVTVGNLVVAPSVTAINTTPQTCGGNDGTASILPSSLNFVWSDGGTGGVRTGLAAGSYNVTATEGPSGSGCSLVFVVNIANDCNCIPAEVSSIAATNASCGAADGAATLNMTTDPADYGFLWIPNFGNSNLNDNARSALPAGHYIVLATYQGNNTCVSKFEFDIFSNCPKCAPFFSVDTMTVSLNPPLKKACIQVPYALASQNVLEIDGTPYTGNLAPCDADDAVKYGFNPLPTGDVTVRWVLGTDTLYGMADGPSSVAAFLNEMDAVGHWYFDKIAYKFISLNVDGMYGKLKLTHLATGGVQEPKPLIGKEAAGTTVDLTVGIHQLTLTDTLSGCSDTLVLTVKNSVIVPTPFPLLQNDTFHTVMKEPVTGNVLVNDHIQQKIKSVKIPSQPEHGDAWVNIDNTVSYRPLIEYCNSYKNMPPDAFTYEVCFEDGSKAQASVLVFVDCIEDTAPTQDVVLYPNPATRFVNLDMSALAGQSADVEVYNSIGVSLKNYHVETVGQEPLRIELAGFAVGHYYVQIRSEGYRPMVRKFVVAERR